MVEVLKSPDGVGVAQPFETVTYARKIDKAEARIDFSKPAHEVLRQIHALSPFPGAWMMVNGMRVKILKCRIGDGQGSPGTFISDGLRIACGTQAIQCLELQREGKGVMDAASFLRGWHQQLTTC